jgi:hypothetical protein
LSCANCFGYRAHRQRYGLKTKSLKSRSEGTG